MATILLYEPRRLPHGLNLRSLRSLQRDRSPKSLHPLALFGHSKGMAIATVKPPSDFAQLVRTHQAGVWRYLRFLGADESQADDLTQETFLLVYRRPFVEHSPASTAAYLRTVARRQFLMAVRKSKRRPTLENLDLADEVWARLTGDDGINAYLDALRECLESLEGRARQAIELHYRENQSRAEIGRALEIGEDGVKSLLRRTRELLRRCVEKRILEP